MRFFEKNRRLRIRFRDLTAVFAAVFLSLIIMQLSGNPFVADIIASDLPIRGQARGEPGVKVGDKAPLVTPELKDANATGKVIALMLGYSSHCPWCDKMERYISVIMKETGNYGGHAVFIQTQIEHAKLIQPPPEGKILKKAYGVEGQPWLFIIDRRGVVRFIYKIFVPSETFRKNVKELLEEKD